MKQIWNPFFTTKRTSGGTGLGLPISQQIIKEHGGQLILESEPKKGTTAIVLLPATKFIRENPDNNPGYNTENNNIKIKREVATT